jgi:hypothetical protein
MRDVALAYQGERLIVARAAAECDHYKFASRPTDIRIKPLRLQ